MIKKLLAAVMLVLSTASFANEYKLFINNPVGSGPDVIARKISDIVKAKNGINLAVINATAGNGLLAVNEFKKERLAVTFAGATVFAYLPVQLDNVPYSINDFNVIHTMGIGGVVFFTGANSPIRTLDDLVRVLPTLEKSAIGVSSGDALANARALVNAKKLNVPVTSFKNHNEVVLQTAGGHITVGALSLAVDSVWATAEAGQLRILGVVSPGPFTRNGKTYPSINQTFNLPSFYSGAWMAITPGESDEHQRLKTALLAAVKDPELQPLIRRTWPLSNVTSLQDIISTAQKHKDLVK